MRRLYHLPLDPGSRKVRLILQEKRLDFALKIEKVWERREAFLSLNPAGEVPVLVEPDGTILANAQVIAEYLDEVYPAPPLLPGSPIDRAETRRLVAWFDEKFAQEVSDLLVEQKVMRRFLGLGHPDVEAMRAAHANVHYHLDYVSWLSDRRTWLAGRNLTVADFAAAAHFSVIDYLGDVPWADHPGAKDWYQRIKSRPCFQPLLEDLVPGAKPPKHYVDLDF